MIARLKGIVDQMGDDWVVIDVGGVGYLVSCASRTLARLGLGTPAQLHIETWVREDAILLYGFFDLTERDWFRLLTTVQGVGAKVGLSLLSVAPPDQLVRAIAAGDKTVLTQATGVGPKLALRILTELKDKVGGLVLGAAPRDSATAAVPAPTGALEDAVSALVNLGYRRLEAFEAAGAALAELGEGAPETALIRAALKRLAKDLTK